MPSFQIWDALRHMSGPLFFVPHLIRLAQSAVRSIGLIACLSALMSHSAFAAIPTAQRQVLLDLYTQTGGASWITSTNWNGAAGTECTWYGVACDAAQANVTLINLPTNNLVGTLPSISALTNLEHFNVRQNQLTGNLPSLATHTALISFEADMNQFSGTIPSLAGLTKLESLRVSANQLTGSVPSLAGLTALSIFQPRFSIRARNDVVLIWDGIFAVFFSAYRGYVEKKSAESTPKAIDSVRDP